MATRLFARKLGLIALIVGSASPHAAAQEETTSAGAATDATAPASVTRLTAQSAAQRASESSYSAEARAAEVQRAAARVDQAWAAFLPRLTTTAQYARLSDFTAPTLPGRIVATNAPAGTINPTPTQAVEARFPTVVDSVMLKAELVVPISDYFLRIGRAYTAASHSVEAARHDLTAARSKAAADAQVAYYAWLRARSAFDAAEHALAAQRVHLQDASSLFASGSVPRTDVLRAQSAVSSAEFAVASAASLVAISEVQLRIAISAPENESVSPAESLNGPLPPLRGDLATLVLEAQRSRAEIRSLDANAAALRERANATDAERWPTLGAFGDVTYAHPNMRRFPLKPEWFPTWAAGVRLTWTPTDLPGVAGKHDEVRATLGTLDAQRNALRDAIRIDVTTQWHTARLADMAVVSSELELRSASESYQAALDLYRNGQATWTALSDAEAVLTRARLAITNAQADARIARVRLEHALGRTGSGNP